MDDQQNRSIFYIHCRHMPTKSGKVTKGYKKKKTWAASRRAPGWKPAKQSKYFSTTIMGCAPLVIQTGSQADINGGQLQDQRASYSFSLNYLNNPDVAHYLAVFDEYCVTKIEVHQTPRSNQAAIINATEPPGGPNPTYWNAVTHVATECEPQVSTPTNAIQVMQQDSYFNIEQTKGVQVQLQASFNHCRTRTERTDSDISKAKHMDFVSRRNGSTQRLTVVCRSMHNSEPRTGRCPQRNLLVDSLLHFVS